MLRRSVSIKNVTAMIKLFYMTILKDFEDVINVPITLCLSSSK